LLTKVKLSLNKATGRLAVFRETLNVVSVKINISSQT